MERQRTGRCEARIGIVSIDRADWRSFFFPSPFLFFFSFGPIPFSSHRTLLLILPFRGLLFVSHFDALLPSGGSAADERQKRHTTREIESSVPCSDFVRHLAQSEPHKETAVDMSPPYTASLRPYKWSVWINAENFAAADEMRDVSRSNIGRSIHQRRITNSAELEAEKKEWNKSSLLVQS